MVKIEWKKNLILALPVTAAVWLIGFLMLKLNLGAVTNLFASIPATSAVTPTFGAKGIALLGGLVPASLTIPAIIVLFISAFLTLIIGELVVDLLFKGKTLGNIMGFGADAGKLATVILLGALVGYLVFVGLKLPGLFTFLGVLIHTVLVVIVAVLLAKLFKMKV